ncbi:hypothetical protein [Gallaecimonas sp. GXIMD4217]|uniref:hypothetical protein n=1 Tax=Gallaecimonas sp. GXIMD4217 TaxID=3131927 RepID=UPI00311B33CF
MKPALLLIALLALAGCSSNGRHHTVTCKEGALCAAAAVAQGIARTEKPSGRCEDMVGERRQQCEAQLDAIRAAIEKHK